MEEEKGENVWVLANCKFRISILQGQAIEGILFFWTCTFFHFARARNMTAGVQTWCTLLALLLWTTSTQSVFTRLSWEKKIT